MEPTLSGRDLLNFPTEILYMIVDFAVTPLDDPEPLDQKSTSSVKALSMVNKRLRDICLKTNLLQHIRMWKKECNLAQHLSNIYRESKDLLRSARSLSIRSIGPEKMIPVQNRPIAQIMPGLARSLLLVMNKMPNLTELRLVTDNGQFSIEPALRNIFDSEKRTFPTVKSLYVRTSISLAKAFLCFPNLEAINFNLHGQINNAHRRALSRELEVLSRHNLPIRTLAIYKTGFGWTRNDITALLIQFPDIERLFLEGNLNIDVYLNLRFEAGLFSTATRNHAALRHLALTDQVYIPPGPHYQIARRRVSAADHPDLCEYWASIAATVFAANPNLASFTIGRQVDFKARVFHPPPFPENIPGVGPVLVRAYDDAPGAVRLNYPPSSWATGELLWREKWGPVPGEEDMAVPGEPRGTVKFVSRGTREDSRRRMVPAAWVVYPEMVRDRCETSFREVEWLRVVRGLN